MSDPPAEPATESASFTASRRPQVAPSECLVSRGGRRAASFLAREARRSLHQGRWADATPLQPQPQGHGMRNGDPLRSFVQVIPSRYAV